MVGVVITEAFVGSGVVAMEVDMLLTTVELSKEDANVTRVAGASVPRLQLGGIHAVGGVGDWAIGNVMTSDCLKELANRVTLIDMSKVTVSESERTGVQGP